MGGRPISDFILSLTGIALAFLIPILWPTQVRDRWFLALASLVLAAAKIMYVSGVEMPPISDFERMWAVSGKMIEHGLPPEGITIHYERSIPYLLPLRAVFGPESSSYSVANVITGLASSLLTYALARRWFGRKAARVAFVLSACAIETWMAAEIPTHDIPGAFFALLGITLYVFSLDWWRAGRVKLAAISTGIFGVVALLLDLQRTTGMFLIATCAFFGIASILTGPASMQTKDNRWPTLRRLSWVISIFLILPFGVYTLLDTVLVKKGLAIDGSKVGNRRALVLVAATDSWADASWGHYQQNYNAPYKHLTLQWGKFAATKLVSDTARFPLSRMSLYIRKARSLFDLGTQTGFYISGAQIAGGTKIDLTLELRVLQTNRTFSFAFLIVFAVGVMRLFGTGDPQIEWFVGIAYLALISCALLFFSEVQPRYLYPIWYFGAIYVGSLFRNERAGL
jgi:hypothetical protein